ncbi:ribosomal L7Ae/L30e/S12e/Gadd45 family protein [Hathewaya histolytica]|uniref:50S ribosomal protein L7Ae/L30e/S12e/Gadd45 n=1 Tax=Hathewaya histolytica TaxID=1498 RepID=A0A4U9RCS6_HATHI|nr:ribosomal L7Ae/L30e/S12e/Gadd45 family protein [Hathewaya histolytica]VTQ89542.1 50S ribosomal protein L7Ae/L30e/S12e/Gadd45 [Hathewaya histolytica]
MKNNEKFYNLLRIAKKAGALTEGYNRVENAIKNKKVFLVFISKELSINSQRKFKNYALKKEFYLIENAPLDDIGEFLGNSNIKVLGITDSSFSTSLKSLYIKD